MQDPQISRISNFIWSVADEVLRDLYVLGKYRDVILPMTVLRRLDVVPEPTKDDALKQKDALRRCRHNRTGRTAETGSMARILHASQFTLRSLLNTSNRQQLAANFREYLDGFSPNVQDILRNFEFHNQISRLSAADALGTVIEMFLSPDINLSLYPVSNDDGSVRIPGLDNHAMGTIFEDLVRRLNEDNNEETWEHGTPEDGGVRMEWSNMNSTITFEIAISTCNSDQPWLNRKSSDDLEVKRDLDGGLYWNGWLPRSRVASH